jgi:hypothetical protein
MAENPSIPLRSGGKTNPAAQNLSVCKTERAPTLKNDKTGSASNGGVGFVSYPAQCLQETGCAIHFDI